MVTRKVNLGSGRKPLAGYLNVDRHAAENVDLVHDVDVFPWPFSDGELVEVASFHLFEHVVDPLGFMAEVHRVLEPGGLLHIEVPHYLSPNAFTDPTHVRYYTEDTFRYWTPGSWLFDMGGPAYHRGCEFTEELVQVIDHDLVVKLRKV